MSDQTDQSPKELTARDMMTTDVVTVQPTSTLQDAIRIMVSKRIRHLPVVKDGKVVAMLSDRDIRLMATGLIDPEKRQGYMTNTVVMNHASTPVISGPPDISASDAAKIFVESRIGSLPIVNEDGQLVGILTHTDLLNWLAQFAE